MSSCCCLCIYRFLCRVFIRYFVMSVQVAPHLGRGRSLEDAPGAVLRLRPAGIVHYGFGQRVLTVVCEIRPNNSLCLFFLVQPARRFEHCLCMYCLLCCVFTSYFIMPVLFHLFIYLFIIYLVFFYYSYFLSKYFIYSLFLLVLFSSASAPFRTVRSPFRGPRYG